ncbi:FMN-binding glutamate synthase family protein [Brevibacillus parabrevis]|jgi:glutamate synthase domain-containing protein 2|uniref:FMN-binding glutamate synthase family protein n=1 Tax=Brevibacillus parabrevis TaxID=54914 RepID=A0A4Y3PSL1_BREPA|nr:FMN-binding glutamate synthase family protein [Brevibacillus parabrevis]RNB92722.1 FMN-binding glutamate synthase family protein [Brevibacillus parabrevis]GEB34956.1 FMN-binding glutamate synthase family protein [Brevibacillus parabrevis]
MEKWMTIGIGASMGAFLALVLLAMVAFACSRTVISWVVGRFTKRLMNDRYPENIWEIVSALTKISPAKVLENSLRASEGIAIERPFGSPRKFLNYDGLVFSPAQLAVLPAHEDAQVDTQLTIGPMAKKPLTLQIPLLSGGLGYGVGVSEKAKIAIAKGTAAVGTVTNTGEGGFLPEERENAKYLIYQYHSATWSKSPEILRQADAIEIRMGQGATAGAATFIPSWELKGKASQIMELPDVEYAVIPSKHKEVQQPQDLRKLVDQLRSLTEGVPIGVKMCASAKMEADLEVAISAGVDFISLDGGQAGYKGNAPILQDDVGLPTIYAVTRAVRYLQQRKVKDKITLLSGGGYATPGECLKAMALGVDGVYFGTALLWAMTHDQVIKVVPWEPPTQLLFYSGRFQKEFNVQEGAKYLENFFRSFIDEMRIATLALGKTSFRQVSIEDLAALDSMTSKVTRIPLACYPRVHRSR